MIARRLIVSLVVLGATGAGCKGEVAPETIIDECRWNSATCHSEAEALCDLGDTGTDALARHVQHAGSYPEHIKDLIIGHALCVATRDEAKVDEAMIHRLVIALGRDAGINGHGRHLLQFPPAVQLKVASSDFYTPVAVLPWPDDDAHQREWCRIVPKQLGELAKTNFGALAPLLSHDCGETTDTALFLLVAHVEAPVVAYQDRLRLLHPKTDANRLTAAVGAFRWELNRNEKRLPTSTILLTAFDKIGETRAPWELLGPIMRAEIACDDLNLNTLSLLFKTPRKWTREGKAALAKVLMKQQRRCREEMGMTSWEVIEGLGDEQGLPLAVRVYWPSGTCDTLSKALVAARKDSRLSKSDDGKWEDPNGQNSLAIRAYNALETEGRATCPDEFQAASSPSAVSP